MSPRSSIPPSPTLATCAAAANANSISSLPADLPPIRGDRAQLVQLLDNLISNAVRYGCDRPDSRIVVAASRGGRWITLSVTDHGPGIPREHLPRVTERFYRVDAARSRESGGTGLGLAIVKHIVERHKGALEVKSTIGVGTSVTVRLPIGPLVRRTRPAPRAAAAHSAPLA